MSELRDAAKRVLADPHDLDALVALERAVYATPDRADEMELRPAPGSMLPDGTYPDRADLRTAVGRFLRRTGGLRVRFDGGRAYVRVPTDWLDDLDRADP